MLLKAHESLLRASNLLEIMGNLRDGSGSSPSKCRVSSSAASERSFVELGRVWQAPLYEITLKLHPTSEANEDRGWLLVYFVPEMFQSSTLFLGL